MYREGLGVDKDLLKAREWLQKAANQGYTLAIYALDSLNATGR